ncbi:MAG: transcription antitermination factor NusB [Bifidobacteriaceae bacterium]|nr:transcription antitermination factor NusB [Bifidobacteriaceae bacterium]
MGRGSRTAARRRAVELVFESLQRGVPLTDLLAERAAWLAALAAREGAPSHDADRLAPYTVHLVEGVARHQELISEWLDTYSKGWAQDRMPAVDRAIMYVGAYEVVFEADVPDPIVLKEAADLASRLSTDKSPNFVSGLLGRLSKIKTTLV